MHPSGGKSLADLLPQERADLVAHDAVQHPAGLLGIHQLLVDAPGVLHAVFNAGLGDLIKGHPVRLRFIQLQELRQVPADGLSLTIGVGRQVHIVALFGLGAQLFYQLALALDILIVWGKVILHIHAHPGSRQVAHMAHRGHHFIVGAKVLLDGMRLGRGFHDH